jgi:hypothetical protein
MSNGAGDRFNRDDLPSSTKPNYIWQLHGPARKAIPIIDCVAEAIMRSDGAPTEKSNSDRVCEALSEVLGEYARAHGITLQQAFNEMLRQAQGMDGG